MKIEFNPGDNSLTLTANSAAEVFTLGILSARVKGVHRLHRASSDDPVRLNMDVEEMVKSLTKPA